MTKLITRKQNRLNNYDYSLNEYYFVTVCSKNRKIIFGEYNNNNVGAPLACSRIELSIIGQIIDNQWNNIVNQYNHIKLDQYTIMPNHIHGIIIINNRINELSRAQASGTPTIGQIIRSFKSKSTLEYIKYINDNNLNVSGKIWQRSFHDHIIRNEKSLDAIRNYIAINPENWGNDIDNLLNNITIRYR